MAKETGDYRQLIADLDRVFGETLRAVREDQGLSQTDIADRLGALGISWYQTTGSKVEAGERPVKMREALALALILDCPLSRLLGSTARYIVDPGASERGLAELSEVKQFVDGRMVRLLLEHGGTDVEHPEAP